MFIRFLNDIQVSVSENIDGLDDLGYIDVPEYVDGDIWKIVNNIPTKMTDIEKTEYLQQQQDLLNYSRNRKKLRIYDFIGGKKLDSEVKNIDFTLIGLHKHQPEYNQGRKYLATYLDDNENVVVRKTFSDVIGNHSVWGGSGFINVQGIIGIQILFEWIDVDGNVGLSKTEIVKSLNIVEEQTLLRERRVRSIDYLIASAKGTDAEPVLDSLYTHYETFVKRFKEYGDDSFKNAILNETDATIIYQLSIQISKPNNTQTSIKNNILYQIGAITKTEYEDSLTSTI